MLLYFALSFSYYQTFNEVVSRVILFYLNSVYHYATLTFVIVIGFEPIQSETPDLQSGPALPLRRTPPFQEPVEGFEPPTR